MEETRLSPTTVLPARYEQRGGIDLSRSRLAAIGMNVAAFGLLLPVTWLLVRFLGFYRPGFGGIESGFEVRVSDTLLGIPALAMLLAVEVVAHELVHGLCYWAFTGQRPVFGLRGLYAFAGAPRWYVPRLPFVLTALAPLVVITTVGLPLLLVVASPGVWPVLAVVALNAAGSLGDLVAAAWALALSPTTLVRDTGEAVTFYQPA